MSQVAFADLDFINMQTNMLFISFVLAIDCDILTCFVGGRRLQTKKHHTVKWDQEKPKSKITDQRLAPRRKATLSHSVR